MLLNAFHENTQTLCNGMLRNAGITDLRTFVNRQLFTNRQFILHWNFQFKTSRMTSLVPIFYFSSLNEIPFSNRNQKAWKSPKLFLSGKYFSTISCQQSKASQTISIINYRKIKNSFLYFFPPPLPPQKYSSKPTTNWWKSEITVLKIATKLILMTLI